ncbi:MAG: hypothetical protein BWY98_00035 [Tenericutes bacterium ADurb.BinA155]|jgi:hypothetical protein|nr:MAG: hypothetical protein BWY98_00035 [Tenericutes bacterium ADurb.BinA155]
MAKAEDQAAFLKKQAHGARVIKVGLVLLCIGSVLLFLDAAFELLVFIASPIQNAVKWNSVPAMIQYCAMPVAIVFLILSGIGGFSYARGKGPFISFVSLMAVILLISLTADLVLSIVSLVQTANWGQFGIDLLSLQLSGLFYFAGWVLAKDDFN